MWAVMQSMPLSLLRSLYAGLPGQVETKTRRDIEDKKNQLRQLVGNSYRHALLQQVFLCIFTVWCIQLVAERGCALQGPDLQRRYHHGDGAVLRQGLCEHQAHAGASSSLSKRYPALLHLLKSHAL